MSTGIDSAADFHTLLVDALGRLRVFDEWETVVDIDAATNDSDKSLTVTADYEWIIQSIFVDLTTTATVGNRQVTVEIQDDATNILAVVKAGIVQAASLQRYYTFAPDLPNMTAFVDTSL